MMPGGEIGAGALAQGSEKLWGATSHALKAYCASHGLPHGKYADRRRAAMELAEQQDTPLIRSSFDLASSCHSNYHNDWMEQEDLDSCLISIEGLVQLILEARAR